MLISAKRAYGADSLSDDWTADHQDSQQGNQWVNSDGFTYADWKIVNSDATSKAIFDSGVSTQNAITQSQKFTSSDAFNQIGPNSSSGPTSKDVATVLSSILGAGATIGTAFAVASKAKSPTLLARPPVAAPARGMSTGTMIALGVGGLAALVVLMKILK